VGVTSSGPSALSQWTKHAACEQERMSKVVCFLGNRNVQLSKHAWEFGRKIISGKTSLKGEFVHVISSSRKIPQVFLYILTV
jgi:hypothetical protein